MFRCLAMNEPRYTISKSLFEHFMLKSLLQLTTVWHKAQNIYNCIASLFYYVTSPLELCDMQ